MVVVMICQTWLSYDIHMVLHTEHVCILPFPAKCRLDILDRLLCHFIALEGGMKRCVEKKRVSRWMAS